MAPAHTKGLAHAARKAKSVLNNPSIIPRNQPGSWLTGRAETLLAAGVSTHPTIQRHSPPRISTPGALNAVHPSEARSGHGRASIRGRVGSTKIPKGHTSHAAGSAPVAQSRMEGSGTGTIGPTRTPRERATPTCTMEAKATSASTGSAVRRKASTTPEDATTPSAGLLALVPTNPAMVNVHAETAQRHRIQVRPRN